MSKDSQRVLVAFLVGILFSIGLALSGMTQPHKVIGFLDLLGKWDPSLLFVMGGALSIHFWSYKYVKGRPHPIFDDRWHFPTSKEITSPLIIGSGLFGIGWGLAGYCPGPALTSLGAGSSNALIVVGAMTLGMWLYKYIKTT